MLGKGWLIVGFGVCASLASATVTATNIFACDAHGASIQPQLGDEFYLAVDVQSDKSSSDPVSLSFTAPSGNRQTPPFAIYGQDRVIWGPFRALMDASMAIDVKVLETGQIEHVTVNPIEPASAIETYAPLIHKATLAASWSGVVKGAKWWLPVPVSGPFQQIATLEEPGTATVGGSSGQLVSQASELGSVTSSISFTGLAVRSNASLLRAVTFKALDAAAPALKPWLSAETYLPTTNKEISAFVSTALGKSYRASTTPYAAAQALYLATIKKLAYVTTPYAPDALQALHRGTGDCGSFSSLFVAACRNAGIPARPACGFTAGTNQWHVWAEFWLPNIGWIPVDATYADGLRPQGDQPLYFGVIPDLNSRLVTSYGFDRTIGKIKVPMLQSPALFLPNTRVQGSLQISCNLGM